MSLRNYIIGSIILLALVSGNVFADSLHSDLRVNTLTFSSMNLGLYGFQYSRELYPNFAIGAGFGIGAGMGIDHFDPITEIYTFPVTAKYYLFNTTHRPYLSASYYYTRYQFPKDEGDFYDDRGWGFASTFAGGVGFEFRTKDGGVASLGIEYGSLFKHNKHNPLFIPHLNIGVSF